MDDASRTIENEEGTTAPAETPKAKAKAKWTKPVIVPLSVSLTKHTPGVGSDGDVFPDSTRP